MENDNTTQETAYDIGEYMETDDGEQIEVAVSPLLRIEKPNRFGSVPGLDDNELLDEQELERLVTYDQYGALLRLSARHAVGFRPDMDEHGHVIGAFGSVDFARIAPEFDKALYKLDMLREKLADTLHTLGIVRRRLPQRAMYLVLKYHTMGIIASEHIVSEDIRAMLRLTARINDLKNEIAELRQYRKAKRARALAQALAALPG